MPHYRQFVKTYKEEFAKWEHGKPIDEKSIINIEEAYLRLNDDDKHLVLELVLNDLKRAYIDPCSIELDFKIAYEQKKKFVELKVFMVKFLVIAFGSSLVILSTLYILSEIISMASSPTDFLGNFSKYIKILIE